MFAGSRLVQVGKRDKGSPKGSSGIFPSKFDGLMFRGFWRRVRPRRPHFKIFSAIIDVISAAGVPNTHLRLVDRPRFTLVATDRSAARSILVFKHDEDKVT